MSRSFKKTYHLHKFKPHQKKADKDMMWGRIRLDERIYLSVSFEEIDSLLIRNKEESLSFYDYAHVYSPIFPIHPPRFKRERSKRRTVDYQSIIETHILEDWYYPSPYHQFFMK